MSRSLRLACALSAILAGPSLLATTASAQAQAVAAKVQAAPKPKTPLYDEKADADLQIKSAVAKAKRDGSRVLVMFGFNSCGWCHKLHDLFEKDKGIRKTLHDEYQVVMVDIKAPRSEEWLDKAHAALPKGEDGKQAGFPFLAVIDEDGKVVKGIATGPLEVGPAHDPAKVLAVLESSKAPARDAAKSLEEAISRAKSEDKRVFLHFGAPWCGWCHKLDDFLAIPEVASIVGADYVDLKIDTQRTKEGQAILDKFTGGKQGGIPWFVVLDGDGKPLATSDGPKGNIGYPAAPEEISHFMGVLTKTARKASEADRAKLKSILEERAKSLRLQ